MESNEIAKKEQISAWIAELESRRETLDRQAQRIELDRREVERQLTLLRELLNEKPSQGSSREETGDRFRDVLLAVLQESSQPMHLVEIRAALAQRGVQVPGQGMDANIIAHLRRLPGVYRVSRGTYSTTPQESTGNQSVRQKRRRRRRRRVSTLQEAT